MVHYVQYHNPDRMGYPCYELSGGEFWIVTKKVVTKTLIGDQIWLIGGEGTPRNYLICEVFVVGGIEISENPDFRFRIWGEKGFRFRPVIDITHADWFGELLQATGNFRFGLSEINYQLAERLEQTALTESVEYRSAQESGW